MTYKFLPHTADTKVEIEAPTIEQAFKESALALKEAICEKKEISPKITKKINIKGNDLKSLLYNFLEEFLYLLDAENFLLNNINNIKINKESLTAEITGDKADNCKFTNNVKAITYSEMEIKTNKKTTIQFVLDV